MNKDPQPLHLSDAMEGIRLISEGLDFLRRGPFDYTMACLLAANRVLLTKYTPFKVGDLVRLAKTPIIDESTSPGWIGSKHFLVAGAIGKVRESSVREDGEIGYSIEFFDESWLDSSGNPNLRDPRHTFFFSEDFLELVV